VAGWLWRSAKDLADHLAFDADDQRPEGAVGDGPIEQPRSSGLATIAFAIAGIVIAIDGLTSAIIGFGTLIADRDHDLFQVFRTQQLAGLVAAFIKIGLGVGLFVGRDRLSAMTDRSRPPSRSAEETRSIDVDVQKPPS